jgi:hypothetical protein
MESLEIIRDNVLAGHDSRRLSWCKRLKTIASVECDLATA